ncbi:MAG: STAS domain-containing protein [Planctomycetota bacterium]
MGSSIQSKMEDELRTFTIFVSGELCADSCSTLYSTIQDRDLSEVDRVILDLSECTRIDSVALGVLLQLREIAIEQSTSVLIRHPSKSVLRVLQTSNFDRLFEVD